MDKEVAIILAVGYVIGNMLRNTTTVFPFSLKGDIQDLLNELITAIRKNK